MTEDVDDVPKIVVVNERFDVVVLAALAQRQVAAHALGNVNHRFQTLLHLLVNGQHRKLFQLSEVDLLLAIRVRLSRYQVPCGLQRHLLKEKINPYVHLVDHLTLANKTYKTGQCPSPDDHRQTTSTKHGQSFKQVLLSNKQL